MILAFASAGVPISNIPAFHVPRLPTSRSMGVLLRGHDSHFIQSWIDCRPNMSMLAKNSFSDTELGEGFRAAAWFPGLIRQGTSYSEYRIESTKYKT
jgi:hypothetical protein